MQWTYVGEIGIELRDHFREHLREVWKKNDKEVSKSVTRHFNLQNHSTQNVTICGLSLHQGNTESRKNLDQNLALNSALIPISESNTMGVSFLSLHGGTRINFFAIKFPFTV